MTKTNKPKITLEDIDSSASEVEQSSEDITVSTQSAMNRLAIVAQEKEELIVENERLNSKAKTTEILDTLIEPYAKSTYWFMVCYCAFVGLFLLMNSFGCFQTPVDSTVLTFLVGSTATTVIGLVGMVLTGIFIGARPK